MYSNFFFSVQMILEFALCEIWCSMNTLRHLTLCFWREKNIYIRYHMWERIQYSAFPLTSFSDFTTGVTSAALSHMAAGGERVKIYFFSENPRKRTWVLRARRHRIPNGACILRCIWGTRRQRGDCVETDTKINMGWWRSVGNMLKGFVPDEHVPSVRCSNWVDGSFLVESQLGFLALTRTLRCPLMQKHQIGGAWVRCRVESCKDNCRKRSLFNRVVFNSNETLTEMFPGCQRRGLYMQLN